MRFGVLLALMDKLNIQYGIFSTIFSGVVCSQISTENNFQCRQFLWSFCKNALFFFWKHNKEYVWFTVYKFNCAEYEWSLSPGNRHSNLLYPSSNYNWRISNQTDKINLLILLFDTFLPSPIQPTNQLTRYTIRRMISSRNNFAFGQQTNDTIQNYILMNSTLIHSIVYNKQISFCSDNLFGFHIISCSQFNLMWIEWNVTSGFYYLICVMNVERLFCVLVKFWY